MAGTIEDEVATAGASSDPGGATARRRDRTVRPRGNMGGQTRRDAHATRLVKLWPGKTEQQKQKLADAITASVTSILDYGDDAVSVALEEIAPEAWAEDVYQPDIIARRDALYKKPGYTM